MNTNFTELVNVEQCPRYKVNRNGEVYDTKRKRFLKQSSMSNGYKFVTLTQGKRVYKQESVHRLVAKAFIPNPENKPQVNHIDGDKLNNCVDNLEWNTISENLAHAYRLGLNSPPLKIGADNPHAKLTGDTAYEIYLLKGKGLSTREVGGRYGVSGGAISSIWRGKTWVSDIAIRRIKQ
ncbi:HNH endonuclease [Bacillus sp. TH13]|uniref:HNH endonuclease n=1 Tax=Bacillus sp. TH13 TaxID=2796379 RepID=UPI001F5B80D0|nr:HNH endonuclease [Bacillus sp. TH13]